ncbi:helix-turn-helix domain-containing protein [Taibaiella helva]|uniref:helix-turn-helix domain-containing protein n=1 Tax=Taibaiella helva TaxID=2301235 RepID=UPI000E58B38A|nr:helix-turn-helix transcriptional regulator [Taibaiella helva]
MKKETPNLRRFRSIPDLHRVLGLSKPMHPLIGLVDNTRISVDRERLPEAFVFDFYKISFKQGQPGKLKYGQSYYDFEDGGLVFTAPHQVLAIPDDAEYRGYTLLIHPDFLNGYPLAKNIRNYGFFSYSANEALYLSEKERKTVLEVFQHIEEELSHSIDEFSQDVLLSQIEVLLNYSNRYYKRQFLTQKAVHHDVLAQLEALLDEYFNDEQALVKGLPTVQYLAGQLHFSPRYLSDMLRSLTGQNTQQHIHEKVIEKAKEYLSTDNLTVAEVAYQLGFEHPQSFNKVFKKKTNLTPLAFKQSFHKN